MVGKIYVLLCAHNGSKYIDEQIQSVLFQSYKVDSLLIFDFDSTDGTKELLLEKEAEYKRVTANVQYIFLDYARGVNSSFQFALNYISDQVNTGDMVFFSDQDDVWLPFKIEKMVEEYRRQGISREPRILHHDVVIVDERMNVLRKRYYGTGQAFLLKERCQHRGVFNTVIGHTIMMNSYAVSYLKQFELNNDFLMYDWFWAFAIERKGRVVFVDQVLSNYRQHQSNQIGIRGLSGEGVIKVLGFVDYVRQIEENFNRMAVSISNRCSKEEKFVNSYGGLKLFAIVLRSFSVRLILIYCLFLFFHLIRKMHFGRQRS